MIKGVIRNFLINFFALWIAAQYVGGLHLTEGLKSILIVSAAFTAIHLFVKPILSLFLGPLNFLTLGLVSLVIDVAILYGISVFLPQISFSDWQFAGFSSAGLILPAYKFNPIGSTIISAVLINLIRSFLSHLALP